MPLTSRLQTLEVNLYSLKDAPYFFTSLPSTIVNIRINTFTYHDEEGAVELLRLLRRSVSNRQVDPGLPIESEEDDADVEADKSKTQTILPFLRFVEILSCWSEDSIFSERSFSFQENYLRRRGVKLVIAREGR